MIIIGEKINGAIPSTGKAIAEKDAEFIRNLAIKQAEAGADFIDVCASVDDDIELETMKWLIDIVQDAVDTPIAVDSPNVYTCIESMKYCNKPGLFNSVSLEGDKVDVAFKVLADTKWECVALLNSDKGIPKTAKDRLEVFSDLMAKCQEYNIDPSRMHIDPLIEMLCTSEDGITMVTEVIREIKKQYPTIHVTGAVSNISFNLPARRIANQAFAVLAMSAGMDSFILDPLNKDMMGMLYATEAMMGEDEYCMEYIGAFREGIFVK
ncbi:methyltetrahydrofolate cobalamin methyltransferase [Acetobacterium wieringae]|uniref:Methyltetrahydrofolate cobalamin methyltransferase n=1 Tax=Acetobacterium wieringae TaxID=52694 RepID=A0ABY6HHZ8_9FIRM|nr:methyltetrahydrofolate cobalamin methyltransferase [Acetobacterium wieringae]UYO64120.1 methyltetrahydrofolate cobalamin methyltransferase [Acetobacterium wieringae]VUZ25651.1 5-methyltetrahydrofolate:corrinoid/iron-sulfur protein co-methyltransferase [Acetobacterium wieringae]